ncbi:UDP-N-acetylmuramate dehydrogenase [Euryhalocaulis caribicus]|uniref:UDP-N-acetylmuramate dehydrogenase n=1 Tax=Euryhalocaulis caribicus TaxID=1161401 RepID=UPI0003A3B220|nr:UDP-N-acetylmuramate dehydrogenase [Euryhalocaulis caribicus]
MSLIDRLPEVRGVLKAGETLAPFTWFRVGGPAEVLFLPKDEADLSHFLAETPEDVPVFVMGVGSNLLVRDGGIPGVVIRLGPAFGKIAPEGDNRLRVGAAALDKMAAKQAARAGVSGLEFFVGVPGSIGGALRMNAGCYGHETKDVLVEAVAIDRLGRRIVAPLEELGYSYRHSEAPDDWIFVEALFQGQAGAPEEIEARMAEITAQRESTQPIREKTGGSTFANPDPPGTENQRRSWQLIDAAGGRGRRVGGAQMSEQHCNFMINTGDATAADIENLGEGIRADVKAQSGVDLRWEIRRVGEKA